MVEENSPVCRPSEQVQPEISAFHRERSENLHRQCTEAYPSLPPTICLRRLRRLEPRPAFRPDCAEHTCQYLLVLYNRAYAGCEFTRKTRETMLEQPDFQFASGKCHPIPDSPRVTRLREVGRNGTRLSIGSNQQHSSFDL
jgi:hypothetical protein